MATLELREAIYYRLSNYTNLTNLTSTRIYPALAPQGVSFPYVTFFQISRVHAHAFGADAEVYMSRVQVDVWDDDYDGADAGAKQVRLALQDYMGSMAGSGDTFTVQRIFYDGRVDMTEVDPQTKAFTYHVAQDFLVWHE